MMASNQGGASIEIALRPQHLEVSARSREFDERHDGERRPVRRQALLGGIEPQRMHLFAYVGRYDFTGHL